MPICADCQYIRDLPQQIVRPVSACLVNKMLTRGIFFKGRDEKSKKAGLTPLPAGPYPSGQVPVAAASSSVACCIRLHGP